MVVVVTTAVLLVGVSVLVKRAASVKCEVDDKLDEVRIGRSPGDRLMLHLCRGKILFPRVCYTFYYMI